jgi:predicted dienelactone hydrolase
MTKEIYLYEIKMIFGTNIKRLISLRMRIYSGSFFIAGLLMISFNLSSQSFKVGHTSMLFVDSSRNNRKIRTEVYYPSGIKGRNAVIAETFPGKFPVICFGHGYQMSWDSYSYLCDSLVPYGFIIAFPKTEMKLFPSHIGFAKDIAFVLSEIDKLGKNPSSFFFNRVDSMNCAMGHSMGGGSAILAARLSSSIRSLALLAPLNTWPSSVDAASELEIPSMIIAGKNDCITPPEIHQVPIYLNLKSLSKIIITIKGGSHCQMADRSTICKLGESTCKPKPDISDNTQHAIVVKYFLHWLNFHLKGDRSSADQFDTFLGSDKSIEFVRNN